MKQLIAILLFTAVAQSWAHETHCLKEEKTLFSCLVGKQIASICTSQDLSPTAGYMQYRYGSSGKVEISLPQPKEHPLKHVEADTYQAASGQNGSITFPHGAYAYTVYWESYRSDTNNSNGSSIWIEHAGLRISKGNAIVADRKCASPTPGDHLAIDPYYLHNQVGFQEP